MDEEQLRRLREESGLRLDGRGLFWHRGELVEHERTLRALRGGMHRAVDGRWATRLGTDWAYVDVEDAAFFVRAIEPRGGVLRAEILDGEPLAIDPSTLAVGAGDALYARLPGGERALFTRAAQLQLAPLLREEGRAIEIAGRLHPLGADGGPEPIR